MRKTQTIRTGHALGLSVMMVAAATAQTKVDLPTQTKRVDFSQATATRPIKTGSVPPANCAVGDLFIKTDAAPGANLYVCASIGEWSGPAIPDVTGLSLGDLRPVRVSGVQVTIGSACSVAAPCNVRIGDTVFAFSDPWVLGNPTGAGTVRFGIDANGNRVAWHNLTGLTCGTGVCAGGTSAFPSGVLPMGSCTVTANAFDANGCADLRSLYHRDPVVAGVGLIQTGPSLSIDAAIVGMRVAVPATAADACTAGSFAADDSFFYVCSAANTWRRGPLEIW